MEPFVHLRLPASFDRLSDALDFVCQQAQLLGFPETQQSKLELVLEELFVNVVNHAYPDEQGELEIACRRETDSESGHVFFVILLRDWGIYFNPLELEPPSLDDNVEDRQIGGLGVFFVIKMADRCFYSRQADMNEFKAYFAID